MNQVLDDEILQTKLSKKGLARSAHFSWDRCAAQTLAILESLATRRSEVHAH
jgi:glycosyltransferase involved in cell wall biosynthesis